MKWFKIVKNFQGGQGIYYATLPKGKTLRKTAERYQLERWGECTNGGHCYGYTIKVTAVKGKPKGLTEHNTLEFYSGYLDDIKKSKIV